jgi:PTH1 family peptidyl-tRNA hydrolase
VPRARFQGETAQVTIRGQSVLLLWPLTWMNLSGASLLAARDFYKIDHDNILVLCDDFQLPTGTIRLRASGSAGGQNGLADVLARLGTNDVPRLRIGIGPVSSGWKTADFVLGRFAKDERETVDSMLERAADAAEEWAALGIEAAMNRYN